MATTPITQRADHPRPIHHGCLRLASAIGLLGGLLGATAGCPSVTTPLAQPPAYEPVGQHKCSIATSSDEPLIVEWPAAQRAKLEALAQHGAVVVRYEGCQMQLLGQCRVHRPYEYTPTTHHRERVNIRNADELYARLPLGAASLETELGNSGELVVDMTIVGTYAMTLGRVHGRELEGDCEGATHVVRGLTVGAFEFYSAGRARSGARADVSVVSGGGRSEVSRTLLRQGGDPAACAAATTAAAAPPIECAALLRIEVEPVDRSASAPAATTSTSVKPATEPATAEPATAEPATTEPATTEPATAEPATAEPATAEPATTEPAVASTVGEPKPAPAAPRSIASPSPAQAPPQLPDESVDGAGGADDWEIYAYVAGGIVLAGLLVAGVVGAALAGDEEETYVPEAGGFGEVTVSVRWPVLEW